MFLGLSLSVTARLRLGASLSIYAVAGKEPDLAFDFQGGFFRTGGTTTTFSDATTFARAGNATMVDSDGLLKWAPHNLQINSEDISDASWGKSNLTAPSSGSIQADAGTFVARVSDNLQTKAGFNSLAFVASAGTHEYIWLGDRGVSPLVSATFDVNLGVVIGSSNVTASITDLGNDEYLCSIKYAKASDGTSSLNIAFGDSSHTSDWPSLTWAGTETLNVSKMHAYRSDLGGMVNNPETRDSYVPTTSAAVYLPRQNHHIYNGTAWVNAGLLVEPESATNLFLNSGTLSTQNVTVANSPNTLHFTGTGTVTLLGASVAGPLVGTGTGENNRVSLTFTPTAGTLTVTVSGTVTNAQLEAGSVPTSYIPTSGATATRAAETLVIPAANLPDYMTPTYIGDELVTNGTFATDSDWTKIGDATITGGVAVLDATISNSAAVSQVLSLTVGAVYELSFSLSVTAGTARGFTDDNAIVGDAKGVGDYAEKYVFVATSADPTFFVSRVNSSCEATTDNVSVREINPLAVSIQMDGFMTYADTSSSTEAQFYYWRASSSNYIQARIDTLGDRTGGPYFLQNANSTLDTVRGADTEFAAGINVPFNIASRHGSTFINGAAEGTALTANTTPVAVPDLSSTDLIVCGEGGPMIISKFRMLGEDIGDTGIAEASE